MTNYKKPAFWIVVAAVALCIVVAVCFLARPRDYGPTVGNPQMLEIPGVEWFSTPVELKEALNISEEQILEEGTYLGLPDLYWLTVTDLTLYGRKVTFARFEFCRYPDGEYAFQEATVMFAENVNMDKLKNNLIEIYGSGQSEPYTYYLYEGDIKQNYALKLKWEQNLEYAAKNEVYWDSVDGNPFQDALDDPNYMTHYWCTEDGYSIIPAKVVECFKSAEDITASLSNEELIEMLDQIPWVAISISNRCSAVLSRDANGPEKRFDQYWTNNCMEFSATLLAEYLYASTD